MVKDKADMDADIDAVKVFHHVFPELDSIRSSEELKSFGFRISQEEFIDLLETGRKVIFPHTVAAFVLAIVFRFRRQELDKILKE